MSGVRSSMIEVCIFRFDGSAPSYLMLRRSESERMYPWLWQYVTGKVEEGETAVEGALRELREETGLAPVHFWSVPFVNALYDLRNDTVEHLPLFCAQVGAGAEPVLSAEHAAAEWLPFREAMARLVWPGQRRGLEIVHEYLVGGQKASHFS